MQSVQYSLPGHWTQWKKSQEVQATNVSVTTDKRQSCNHTHVNCRPSSTTERIDESPVNWLTDFWEVFISRCRHSDNQSSCHLVCMDVSQLLLNYNKLEDVGETPPGKVMYVDSWKSILSISKHR